MSRARTRACVLHVSNLAAGSSESWDQESSAAFVLLKTPPKRRSFLHEKKL